MGKSLVVDIHAPVPSISGLSLSEQRRAILMNARASCMSGLISDFEYTTLENCLHEIIADNDFYVSRKGSDVFWHKAFDAGYHALVRCARLRYAGEQYDLSMTRTTIAYNFGK